MREPNQTTDHLQLLQALAEHLSFCCGYLPTINLYEGKIGVLLALALHAKSVGDTLSNDWLGIAVGGVGVLVGIGSIYATGGTSVPGYSSVISGAHMVYSSINQRKSAIRHATMILVNTEPKTHTETIH